MRLHKIRIRAGAEKPFRVLFMADTHLAVADHAAAGEWQEFSKRRAGYFPHSIRHLQEATEYASCHGEMMIHGGDLIDFVSTANVLLAQRLLKNADVFFCPGNHEYSRWAGEKGSDWEACAQSKGQPTALSCNLPTVRKVHGILFATLNDCDYQVNESEWERLRKVMEMGLPVVLVCHVPFFTPKLCESNLQLTRREDAFLTGLPIAISSKLRYDPALPPSEEWRNSAIQQKASATTLQFTEWLRQQKPLKTILTGHCHHFFAEPFSSTAVQYVVGPQFYGEALEITFL